jgi:DNA/RNA-binding domain of Phe-tRNA-synthetase-like protein
VRGRHRAPLPDGEADGRGLAASPVEPRLQEGFIEPCLRSEFPGLRVVFVVVAARSRPSPPGLVARLQVLSDRFRGASIVALRTQPVPHAYRAFYRQIGLDPDTDRIPVEEAAIRRLAQGHFSSRGLIEDALLIALIETGVPVWALDAERISGPLGVRTSTEGERVGIGEHAAILPEGRLCVADGRCVHAPLFGAPAQSSRPSGATRALALFSVGAPGVPAIHTEEAIWQATEALAYHG